MWFRCMDVSVDSRGLSHFSVIDLLVLIFKMPSKTQWNIFTRTACFISLTHTHTHFPFSMPKHFNKYHLYNLADRQTKGTENVPLLRLGRGSWLDTKNKRQMICVCVKTQKYDKMTEGLMLSHQLPFPPLFCKLNETKTNLNKKETWTLA